MASPPEIAPRFRCPNASLDPTNTKHLRFYLKRLMTARCDISSQNTIGTAYDFADYEDEGVYCSTCFESAIDSTPDELLEDA